MLLLLQMLAPARLYQLACRACASTLERQPLRQMHQTAVCV